MVLMAAAELTWGLLFAFGPSIAIVSALIGGSIVALYIHKVILPRLNHITEMTNSAHAAALKRIQELEQEIVNIKAVVKQGEASK